MTTCYMCDEEAIRLGYCDHHQDILRKQLVLDVLDKMGNKPMTAIEIRDAIRDHFLIYLPWKAVVFAIKSLHHYGFMHKMSSIPGSRRAARWYPV